jgi:hypothetical protein
MRILYKIISYLSTFVLGMYTVATIHNIREISYFQWGMSIFFLIFFLALSREKE